MKSSKILPFQTLSITHYKLKKQKKNIYKQNIQQQKKKKKLNKKTPKHLTISNISILIITHYFNK